MRSSELTQIILALKRSHAELNGAGMILKPTTLAELDAKAYIESALVLVDSALQELNREEPDTDDIPDAVDPSNWTAEQCLLWLADKTGENNFRFRAAHWKAEVVRYAAHDWVMPAEWEATATEELRQAIRNFKAE